MQQQSLAVVLTALAAVAGCSDPPPPPPPTVEERAQDLAESEHRAAEEARTADPDAHPVALSELFPLLDRRARGMAITYLEPAQAAALSPGASTGLLFQKGDKSVAFVGRAQCKQNIVTGDSILAGTGMKSIQFSIEGELFDPKTKHVLEPLHAQQVGLGINVVVGCNAALRQHADAIGEDFVARVDKHM